MVEVGDEVGEDDVEDLKVVVVFGGVGLVVGVGFKDVVGEEVGFFIEEVVSVSISVDVVGSAIDGDFLVVDEDNFVVGDGLLVAGDVVSDTPLETAGSGVSGVATMVTSF